MELKSQLGLSMFGSHRIVGENVSYRWGKPARTASIRRAAIGMTCLNIVREELTGIEVDAVLL